MERKRRKPAQSRLEAFRVPAYFRRMSSAKVAISIDETVLKELDTLVKSGLFRSRSEVVQQAVSEKISRMDKSALARECAKLERNFEQGMADEGLTTEIHSWPKY
jgi:Arc/MetJ-type ribon-helix-helix transcriptional regulator